jgi:cytochrome c peroxidase
LQALAAPSAAKSRLGSMLFFDTRLSRSGKMNCASCHDPGHAWADARPRSLGDSGRKLARNAHSLLNIRYYRAFGWDGRRGRLQDQVLAPIEDPSEMEETREGVLKKLRAREDYAREFRAAYGTSEISWERVGESLAEFVRWVGQRQGLSPFERFRRDPEALDAPARRGMAVFATKARCILCHKGSSLSSNTFYNVGIIPARGSTDDGRKAVTGYGPKGAFRTPSLWTSSRFTTGAAMTPRAVPP